MSTSIITITETEASAVAEQLRHQTDTRAVFSIFTYIYAGGGGASCVAWVGASAFNAVVAVNNVLSQRGAVPALEASVVRGGHMADYPLVYFPYVVISE